MRAKVVIPNKYWILEDGGVMVGTLSLTDENYQLFIPGQMEESFSCDKDVIENDFKIEFIDKQKSNEECIAVGDFPTNCTEPEVVEHESLPCFLKRKGTKTIYAAGYYIIQFPNLLGKAFCPKLSTLENYTYHGPFLEEMERDLKHSKLMKK
jgi:hypothetical protein